MVLFVSCFSVGHVLVVGVVIGFFHRAVSGDIPQQVREIEGELLPLTPSCMHG